MSNPDGIEAVLDARCQCGRQRREHGPRVYQSEGRQIFDPHGGACDVCKQFRKEVEPWPNPTT